MIEKIGIGTTISLCICILTTMLVSFLFPDDKEELAQISTLFSMQDGISYTTILQILSVGVVISTYNTCIDYLRIFRNMLHKWKFVSKLIGSVCITVFFVFIFHWFPIDNVFAWIGFIISFSICMGVSVLLMLYKVRKKNEEYQQLFKNYKK